jgi:hypothetical protein
MFKNGISTENKGYYKKYVIIIFIFMNFEKLQKN